jgi:hypothetical protein
MADILNRAKEALDCGDIQGRTSIVLELVAECERLQDLIDKPPEEAQWIEDFKLFDGIEATGMDEIALRWLMAFRKAQNSNLVRAQQNEWLREELARWQKIAREERAKWLHHNDARFFASLEKAREQAAQELGIPISDHIVEPNQLIRREIDPTPKQEFVFTVRCEKDSSDQLGEPNKLMLTKEQRAALERYHDFVTYGKLWPDHETREQDEGVYCAMLSQSSPAWRITPLKIAALEKAVQLLSVIGSDGMSREGLGVLRGMLEEVK